MTITYLGHSCFLLSDGVHSVLTDPFLSATGKDPDSVKPDVILVSHGHDDHVGDTVRIAKKTGATVGGVIELCEQLFAPKRLKVLVGNIGGTISTVFGSYKMVSAVHGSGVPGALACGFVIHIGGKNIYFAGDTALTMDMSLLKDEAIDAALLPIGGTFTMDPSEACRAVKLIEPKLTIPMHYNTFPLIRQDPHAFAGTLEKEGHACRVLEVGQTLDLP